MTEDDVYWLAVEIIQICYKSVGGPLIAKVAERATEEPIPPGLNEQAIERLLSRRIATEVRRIAEKAPKPIGHHPPRRTEKFPGNRRRSGSLTIVKFSHRDSQGHPFWLALCDCQKREAHPQITRVRQDHYLTGRVTSCGCRRIALMRGNQRARKQSGRPLAAEISQQLENTPLAPKAVDKNLVLAQPSFSGPSACEHGSKLIKLDFDRGDGKACYCELCGLMRDTPEAASLPNWTARLAYENLAMTRGLAPSTDSPTSTRARQFWWTADKVWAAGKNNVLVGGTGELESTGAVRAHAIIGRRRSASGRDKVRPWQNPNVDVDESADAADSRLANHYEPGDRDLDQRIDRRVAKKTENLLDMQAIGLDDCYGDSDEKALFNYELGEKAIDEDAEAIADNDEADNEMDSDDSGCDD